MGWEVFGIEEELGHKLGRRVEFAFEDAMHRPVKARALPESIAV